MRTYPWYDIAVGNEELEQGDFIDNCNVLIPTYTPVEIEAAAPTKQQTFEAKGINEIHDVIIISQSCDLENKKIDFVQLCPMISYNEFVEGIKRSSPSPSSNTKTILRLMNEIRVGRMYRYYMLNACDLPDFTREIQIADLGTSYSIPRDVMQQMVASKGNRLRLLSPYKEQLAQAFAYFYMRVALPSPIDEFKTLLVSTQVGTIPHS
jgi:hypothetical protein